MFSNTRMFFRKMRKRIGCRWRGKHDWFYYYDPEACYAETQQHVQRRTCQRCGLSQVAVNLNADPIWISMSRAEKIMKGY